MNIKKVLELHQEANLRGVDLKKANLSAATGLLSQSVEKIIQADETEREKEE